LTSAIASTNNTPRSAKKARVASSPEVEEEEAKLYVIVHLLIQCSMFHVVMISQQSIQASNQVCVFSKGISSKAIFS